MRAEFGAKATAIVPVLNGRWFGSGWADMKDDGGGWVELRAEINKSSAWTWVGGD